MDPRDLFWIHLAAGLTVWAALVVLAERWRRRTNAEIDSRNAADGRRLRRLRLLAAAFSRARALPPGFDYRPPEPPP